MNCSECNKPTIVTPNNKYWCINCSKFSTETFSNYCNVCDMMIIFNKNEDSYRCINDKCSEYLRNLLDTKYCRECKSILDHDTYVHCINHECFNYKLEVKMSNVGTESLPIDRPLFSRLSKTKPNHIDKDGFLVESNNILIQEFESGAKREKSVLDYYDIAFCGIEALAKIYTEGAARYGHDNWRKGLPTNETFNHLFNHLVKWKLAQEGGTPETEDNLAKVMWGVVALIYEREVSKGNITRVINK